MAVAGEITSVSLSKQTLDPGEQFVVTVQFEHNADAVIDEDYCVPDLTDSVAGKLVTVELALDTESVVSDTKCVEISSGALGLNPGSAEYVFEIPAPATGGDYTLRATARRENSGEFADAVERTITVEGDSTDTGCSADSDCPDGFRCVGGACLPEQTDGGLDLGLLILLAAGGVAAGALLGGGDGKQKSKTK